MLCQGQDSSISDTNVWSGVSQVAGVDLKIGGRGRGEAISEKGCLWVLGRQRGRVHECAEEEVDEELVANRVMNCPGTKREDPCDMSAGTTKKSIASWT